MRAELRHMRQRIGPPSIKLMVCRLFGVKQLSEVILTQFQLEHWEQTYVKFTSKYKMFFRKMYVKCRLQTWVILFGYDFGNVS